MALNNKDTPVTVDFSKYKRSQNNKDTPVSVDFSKYKLSQQLPNDQQSNSDSSLSYMKSAAQTGMNAAKSAGNMGMGIAGSAAKGVGDIVSELGNFISGGSAEEKKKRDSLFVGLKNDSLTPSLSKAIEDKVKPVMDKLPTYEGLVDSIFGKENMKGDNVVSENLFKTARNAPLLALMGASSMVGLGADFSGGMAGSIADSMGLGKGAQLGSSVLGALGFGKVAQLLGKVPKIRSEHIQGLFNTMKDEGSKIVVNPKESSSKLGQILKKVNLENIKKEATESSQTLRNASLEKIKKEATDKFTGSDVSQYLPKEKSEVLGNIESMKRRLSQSGLTADKLYDIKRDLNSVYVPNSKSAQSRFNSKLKDVVSDALDEVGKNHPEFKKAYKEADKLYSIANWKNSFSSIVDNFKNKNAIVNIASNPLTQVALGVLLEATDIPYIKKGAKPLMAFGTARGVSGAFDIGVREAKFINHLKNSSEGKELLWKMAGTAAKNSTAGVLSSINKLNKLADKFDKSEKDLK